METVLEEPADMNDVSQDCIRLQRLFTRFSMVFAAGINNILGRGGINLPQYNAMTILQEQGSVKMGELAKQLGVTMGAATNLADKLVASGTVTRERGQDDRRVVRLALTVRGKRHVEKIETSFIEFVTGVMQQMEPEDRTRFLKDFGLVLDLMDKQHALSQQGD